MVPLVLGSTLPTNKSAGGRGVAKKAASQSSPTGYVKGQAEENVLRAVMDTWFKKYPHEVNGYIKEVDIVRQTKNEPNGLSVDGNMMMEAIIPTRPWILINTLLPEFWQNGGSKKFIRMFSRFNLKDPK